ncbi:MAG: hypothetical protein JWR80_2725 [Bradyrhizobium sp.]|nr:hypothetical protein [Bradyrhizobium sp.]
MIDRSKFGSAFSYRNCRPSLNPVPATRCDPGPEVGQLVAPWSGGSPCVHDIDPGKHDHRGYSDLRRSLETSRHGAGSIFQEQ